MVYLDEPFAFLDTMKKNMIWAMIDEKLAEGKGVIIVSHEDEQDRLKNTAPDYFYLILKSYFGNSILKKE